jgi:CDP-glucose 4,6-dehydratase
MLLAEKLLDAPSQFCSSFNFGPNDEDAWSVERIATKLVKIWGEGASWIRDSVPGVHEAHSLTLDTSRARRQLGWKPRLRIEANLQWTARWYRDWLEGAEMKQETLAQIAGYEQLAHEKL